jgi:hypothetical protein
LFLPPLSEARIAHLSDNGSSKHIRNVGQFLRDYMMQHPRRHVIFIFAAV